MSLILSLDAIRRRCPVCRRRSDTWVMLKRDGDHPGVRTYKTCLYCKTDHWVRLTRDERALLSRSAGR
jgi:hypothetical protein